MRRLILVVLSSLLFGPAAHGQMVVADISQPVVAITTGFTGTDVLFFGAVEGRGRVVAVVEGPPRTVVMRRKERRGLIWVNTDVATFDDAPAFYQIIASESLEEWLPLSVREKYEIGVEYLELEPRESVGPARAAAFRSGLIRGKQRAGVYGELVGRMQVIEDRLFRASVWFPANVPTGMYTIRTMLVQDGEVVSERTTPLRISKAGLEAEIFRMAHQHAALYGIAAIVIAVLAGLGANALFDRR